MLRTKSCRISDWIFYFILHSVMGLFPIVMNIIQFWLIDSIVKATAHDTLEESGPTRPTNGISSPLLSADREPLFSANASEDEDDDCEEAHGHRRVHDIENPASLQRHRDGQAQSVEIKASTTPTTASVGEDEDRKGSAASVSSSKKRDSDDSDKSREYPPSIHSHDGSLSSSSGHILTSNVRSRSATPRRQHFSRDTSPPPTHRSDSARSHPDTDAMRIQDLEGVASSKPKPKSLSRCSSPTAEMVDGPSPDPEQGDTRTKLR